MPLYACYNHTRYTPGCTTCRKAEVVAELEKTGRITKIIKALNVGNSTHAYWIHSDAKYRQACEAAVYQARYAVIDFVCGWIRNGASPSDAINRGAVPRGTIDTWRTNEPYLDTLILEAAAEFQTNRQAEWADAPDTFNAPYAKYIKEYKTPVVLTEPPPPTDTPVIADTPPTLQPAFAWHAQQTAIFDANERAMQYEALPQDSGKSTAGIHWLTEFALNNADSLCWYVSAYWPDAKDKMRRTIAYLRDNKRDADIASIRRSQGDMAIELANGAMIQFKSGANPDSLYGPTVDAIVLDEASRMPEDAYTACMTRLTKTNGPYRIMTNKQSGSWPDLLKATMPPECVVQMTADDALAAGIMTQANYDYWRTHLPEIRWRELYLLEDILGHNPFYYGLEANKTAEFTADDEPVVYGLDLAKQRDYTALVGLNATGQVCYFDRWQYADYTATAERIAKQTDGVSVYADATGVGEAVCDMLDRLGAAIYRVTITNSQHRRGERRSVGRIPLLDKLAAAMETGNTAVNTDIAQTIIDELSKFKIDEDKAQRSYTVPPQAHDDAAFAYALAWHGFDFDQRGVITKW